MIAVLIEMSARASSLVTKICFVEVVQLQMWFESLALLQACEYVFLMFLVAFASRNLEL